MEAALPTSAQGSVLEMTLSLVLILVLIFAAAWMIRRWRGWSFGTERIVRILGQHHVGTRERVVLIQVGDKQLLIGVTAASVNTLLVLDELIDEQSQEAPAGAFARRIQSLMNGERA